MVVCADTAGGVVRFNAHCLEIAVATHKIRCKFT